MIAPTHMTFSLFVYLLLMTPTGIALSWGNALVATLASLLPDLDTQSSTLGKHLRFVSHPLEARFGHRTITHSLVFVAGLFAVLLPLAWWREDLYYCFCIGYATHPLLDTMTVNGVRLFYPVSGGKCVFPMDVNHPHRYRVQTGSRSDVILGITFLLVSLPAYLVAQEGYERFVRITQGSIESAVRDYNDMSRTHRVFGDIRAHNLVTKRSLSGMFELLGSIDEQTLVFREEDGRARTLGREYRSDYAADRAIAVRGEVVATKVYTIDLAGQRMRDLECMMDRDSGALLFGMLAVDGAIAIPGPSDGFQPIEAQPGSIRLAYATVGEIMEAGLGDVLVVRGTLTIRQVVATRNADLVSTDGGSGNSDGVKSTRGGNGHSGGGDDHTGDGNDRNGGGDGTNRAQAMDGTRDTNGLPDPVLTRGPDQTHDSSRARDPAPLYSPTRAFTLTAGKGEQILALRTEGDAVSIGDTLAVRTFSSESREKLESLQADRRRMAEDMSVRRASHREQLGDLREKCGQDSRDLRLAVRLHAAGFCASVSVDAKKAALARREHERVELKASYRRSMERMQAGMTRIDDQIRELQAADSLAQAVLRSPVSGAIRSVRMREQGGNMRAVFSIGVSGP